MTPAAKAAWIRHYVPAPHPAGQHLTHGVVFHLAASITEHLWCSEHHVFPVLPVGVPSPKALYLLAFSHSGTPRTPGTPVIRGLRVGAPQRPARGWCPQRWEYMRCAIRLPMTAMGRGGGQALDAPDSRTAGGTTLATPGKMEGGGFPAVGAPAVKDWARCSVGSARPWGGGSQVWLT